ncbi:MAG: N-succinylarginine dihydrolase [Pseudomonadota bacterium]
MTAREVNFDGLVGPSHNYAGLSFGNVASSAHAGHVANPRAAALQGLAKMQALAKRGFIQAVLPPQMRPDFSLLRNLGFTGTPAAILAAASRTAPRLLAAAWSASPMWAANAATVSPAADTADGRTHFSVANLQSNLHRSREPIQTQRFLQAVFHDDTCFMVHPPLPGTPALADEGAANHGRLCATHGEAGIELFVHGRAYFDQTMAQPHRFPARQTCEAGQAIARRHGLVPQRTVHLQQNPYVIDQGAFHNDVVAVANNTVLFYHEAAFADEASSIAALHAALATTDVATTFQPIRVAAAAVPLADAIGTYLFNSQLLTRADGGMLLVTPLECQENPVVTRYLEQMLASGGPVDEILPFDLRQSMRNGGGPACLRLRVVLTEAQLRTMHQGVLLTQRLYDALVVWIGCHYRDRLAPADLTDPTLVTETCVALEELSVILDLPGLYDIDRND